MNPISGTSPLNSTAVCNGVNVTSFKIDCGNGQVFTKNGSNNGSENFTQTCNYTAAGTYTPTCFVNDTITNNSCQKTVTVTGSSSSSSTSSSGGSQNTCLSISKAVNSVTCL